MLIAYRKAHTKATLGELFEQLAIELESGKADSSRIGGFIPRFQKLLDQLDTPTKRRWPLAAMGICEHKTIERGLYSKCLNLFDGPELTKLEQKADERLLERTYLADLHILKSASVTSDADEASRALGHIWPCGEPRWAKCRWHSTREQKKRTRRMWQTDAPSERVRGAPLADPSPRLQPDLRELLKQTSWNLTYKANREVWTNGSESGSSLQFLAPKRHARRMTLPGSHGFRKPASDSLIADFERRSADVGALRDTWAFFRQHDGALLFRAEGIAPQYSHIVLHGLADQRRAARVVLYWLGSFDNDDPEKAHSLLASIGCDRSSFLVVATIGVSYFVMPLTGPTAGRIIRILASVGRIEPWASSLVEGIARMIEKVVTLAIRQPLLYRFGDESHRGDTELTLAKVTPR